MVESFRIKGIELLTEKLPESVESSRFVSHRAKMSQEFDSRKDSHSTKFEQRPQIFVKLRIRESCDSKLSGLHLLVATSKFRLLTMRQYNATRKHLFPYPHGDRSGLRKLKKDKHQTLITATTSIHLPKPVLNDLTIKSDSVLTNQIEKDGMQGCPL